MNATTATTDVKADAVTPVTANTETATPKPAPPKSKASTSNRTQPPRKPAATKPAATGPTAAPAPTLVMPTTPAPKAESTAPRDKVQKTLITSGTTLRAQHDGIDSLDDVATERLQAAIVEHKRLTALFRAGRDIPEKDLAHFTDLLDIVQRYVDEGDIRTEAAANAYTDHQVGVLHQATGSTFARLVNELNKRRLAGPRFLWLSLLVGTIVGLIVGIWFTPNGMSPFLYGVAIGAIIAGITLVITGSAGNKISPIDPASITEPSHSARADNHTLAAGTHADSPN